MPRYGDVQYLKNKKVNYQVVEAWNFARLAQQGAIMPGLFQYVLQGGAP